MSSNTSKPLIENESSPPRCNIVSCCKKDVIHGVIPVERSALLQKIVLDDTAPPPSWLQKLLCDCNSAQRKLTVSGIQDVPEISNLAGLLLQNGDHSTGGTAMTLKYARFDKEKRVAHIQVYGGGGKWAALDNALWRFVLNVGRCCNYTYRFTFSEDWQKADIDIMGNLCCVACCLPPCANAWFSIPKSYCAFEMYQAEDSVNGSHWIRNTSNKGGPMKFDYNLQAVYGPDGETTDFTKNLGKAPETMLLSR